MVLTALGEAFIFLSVVCLVLVLAHAFRRSLGTAVMVLLIPLYLPVYAFGQFQHPRKGWVLAGLFGGGVLGLTLRALGLASA